MDKNFNNIKAGKLTVAALFILFITASLSQGIENNAISTLPYSSDTNDTEPPTFSPLGDPYFTWEDNFNTQEWIDFSLSYDYEIVDGTAQIKNTYSVWTDPSWTRIKPITINNNIGQTLLDYTIHLDIEYDTDMQTDYADIRFKHENFETVWLDYWIESQDLSSASVWVEIPEIPTGASMMYLFYGNPAATGQSDFYEVFSDWQEKWPNDEQIAYHLESEGAWDPDVTFGDDRFFVAWEEGTAFYFPYTVYQQGIRGSILDTDGNYIKQDFTIRTGTTPYRHENPSAAYGNDKFFVAWEHYGTPSDQSTMNIKGKIVTSNGDVGSEIHICKESNVQADPNVAYDSINNRFFVVWEDARSGTGNYNLYGKLYNTNGDQIGSEKTICDAASSQCEPWVAFNPLNEQYMIVWEEGANAANGPFDIWVGLFDSNLNLIGPGSGANPAVKLADGDTDTDYNFPCVAFCEETERFLVTWNDGDISDDDWHGNIWGTILDSSGNTVVDTFQIRSGNFIRTDIALYLSATFLVSYNGGGKIWGKLVSSDGEVFTNEIQMSASTAAFADWVNLATGDGKIFAAWEDTRIVYSPPWNGLPDIFGNIWHLNIPSGSDVSCVVGNEVKQLLTAQVTSKAIQPENLVSWYEFDVESMGSITYDILNDAGDTILIADASSGEDLTGIDPASHTAIRLQAHFTRDNPSYSPTIDKWSIIYVGIDDDPPETTIQEIVGTEGKAGWYTSNVKIILQATDGLYGTGVNHTYFQIDEGIVQEYDDAVGIKFPPDDPNQLSGIWDVYFWSVDKAGNIEPPRGPITIKIDKAPPYVEIWNPPDRATVRGDFLVQATASDNGSGVDYVQFDTGPPYEDPVRVYDDDPPGSGNYSWLCTRHLKKQWKHIIAQVYDVAGHMTEYNIYVYFANADDGVYHAGYVYLFRNLTLGPSAFLQSLGLAIALDFNTLIVRVPEYNENASSVEFIAKRIILLKEFTGIDNDLSDGCSVELKIPMGLYGIKAYAYDDENNLIEDYNIISNILVLLF